MFIGWFFFSLFFFSLPLLLYIPLFLNPNFYKDLIVENVNRYTDYRLQIEDLKFAVYPSLHLSFDTLHVDFPKEKLKLVDLKTLSVSIFWPGFFAGQAISIDEFSLKNGLVDVPAILKSLTDSKEEKKEDPAKKDSSKRIIEFLDKKLHFNLSIENLEIKIRNFHPKIIKHELILTKLNISYRSFSQLKLDLDSLFGKSNLLISAKGGIDPKELSVPSIFLDADIELNKFPLYEYANYLKSLPSIVLSGTHANLKVKINKKKSASIFSSSIPYLHIQPLQYKGDDNKLHALGPILLSGKLHYPFGTKKLQTESLKINIGNLLDLDIDSSLNFTYRPNLKLRIHSNRVNVDKILAFTNSLNTKEESKIIKPETEEKKEQAKLNLFVDLHYSAGLIHYDKYNIRRYYLNSVLNNEYLHFTSGLINFFKGQLKISGDIFLKDTIRVLANVKLQDIDMKELSKEYLGNNMIEGTLHTALKVRTDNQYKNKDFFSNLYASGSSLLLNGVLHDRADILYPIRFLNKIIPSDKKLNSNLSRYKTIDIAYLVKNKRFKIKHFDMQGSIFNTLGKADIGLDNPKDDISASLMVSSSLAGKGLKIPMHYSRSDYMPFSIDKVWLAGVYTGMVMGGPIGAVIGSALSEKAGATITTLQNKGLKNVNALTKDFFTNE